MVGFVDAIWSFKYRSRDNAETSRSGCTALLRTSMILITHWSMTSILTKVSLCFPTKLSQHRCFLSLFLIVHGSLAPLLNLSSLQHVCCISAILQYWWVHFHREVDFLTLPVMLFGCVVSCGMSFGWARVCQSRSLQTFTAIEELQHIEAQKKHQVKIFNSLLGAIFDATCHVSVPEGCGNHCLVKSMSLAFRHFFPTISVDVPLFVLGVSPSDIKSIMDMVKKAHAFRGQQITKTIVCLTPRQHPDDQIHAQMFAVAQSNDLLGIAGESGAPLVYIGFKFDCARSIECESDSSETNVTNNIPSILESISEVHPEDSISNQGGQQRRSA
eukprot:gnl/MRDRNA2_/MRDRNA2_25983_c0_seq1.p1 gnl/MRDRNA2_/MRDRNA2_25983_c0~~gnl/MRDRNA2_/MRDRNA2_25983_c0_seq1.p1  ORF type:complete len:371 (+),score=36.47 gnl/MRDRNA2_/MRDRNA2_25983_c0_seq1:128-1114(+)